MKKNEKVKVETFVEKKGNKARVRANVYITGKDCVMDKFGKTIGKSGCYVLTAAKVALATTLACILAVGLIAYSAVLYPFRKFIGGPSFTPVQVAKDATHIPQEAKELWKDRMSKC